MPIKKYLKECTLYKRVEKVSPSPPLSTSSTSLQLSNSLATDSIRSSSTQSNHHQQNFDDEYNPYKYGFVPLSERNIYREFQVIQPPKNMVWKEDLVEHHVDDDDVNKGEQQKSTAVERIIKPVLTDSVAKEYINTTPTTTLPKPKTVRIVDSPYKWSTSASRRSASRRPLSNSSNTIRETVIPISHQFELEPVPTTFSSYKCTKYTLNEIRSC